VMFLVLGLAQLGVALAVRAKATPGTPRNRMLPAAVAVCLLLQFAGVLVEPLRLLLGTEPLDVVTIVASLAVATLPGVALRLRTRTVAGREGDG
jgi:Ca2+-transporting ATPase